MTTANRTAAVLATCAVLLGAGAAGAQDWPQWRGAHGDARAKLTAPKTWPKELTKKWSEKVGDGVATPALVGDRLYVFTRQGDEEVLSCRSAADGKEAWHKGYASAKFGGPDGRFLGPRSSPAVADGKVVTLGALGVLTCWDAKDGKQLWQKTDFKGSYPMFHVSSSPLIVNGLVVAQQGRGRSGGIFAYDLANGDEKWKWTGDGPGYASPVEMTFGDTKAVVAETDGNIIVLNAADGKKLWETPFKARYNACTPVVEGQTIIFSADGVGTKAVKLEKDGDKATAKELWNRDAGVQFSTPVVKGGLLVGISASDKLFCLNAQSGKTDWSTALGGGGGGRGMMGGGYGSVVDAGSVLLALTPSGQLTVFDPSGKAFKEVAKYKVADRGTYAYPVVSGNRIFVKDSEALTLWTVE